MQITQKLDTLEVYFNFNCNKYLQERTNSNTVKENFENWLNLWTLSIYES